MGALESELRRRGIEVTAAPLDSVIGACAAARGINIVHGDTKTVFGALSDRRFDAVIVLDLLHLFPMPVDFLRRLRALLVHDGIIVASVPNIAGLRTKWKRIKGDMTLRHLARYDRSGVHEISGAALTEWFTAAGFTRMKLIPKLPAKTRWWTKSIGRLFPMWLAEDFIIQAQYDQNRYTFAQPRPHGSPRTNRLLIKHAEMTVARWVFQRAAQFAHRMQSGKFIQGSTLTMTTERPLICILGATFNTENRGVSVLAAGALRCVLNRFPEARIIQLDYAQERYEFQFLYNIGHNGSLPQIFASPKEKAHLPNNIGLLILLTTAGMLVPFTSVRRTVSFIQQIFKNIVRDRSRIISGWWRQLQRHLWTAKIFYTPHFLRY